MDKELSDTDIEQLSALLHLLRKSFKGAYMGSGEMDDCADSLEKAIEIYKHPDG